MKKFLICHPDDRSTDFLRGLYKVLPDKTLITGGMTKSILRKKIERGDPDDRLIFCGHGCPSGLFGVGQFPDTNGLIIDESMVESLKTRPNSLFIWCNADQFIHRHGLAGFYTGMFISEVNEALWLEKTLTLTSLRRNILAISME